MGVLIGTQLTPEKQLVDLYAIMGLSAKSLAGPGYVILNVLRVMNIIALLAVACASVVMLVKTFIVSKVWSVHTEILFQC